MKKLFIILILSMILISGCVIRPEVSICDTKNDLSTEEINNFENISTNYINYIKNENIVEIENHLSSSAKASSNPQDTAKLIQDIKTNFGDFKEDKVINIFKIQSTPKMNVICTDDMSNKKETLFIYTLEDLSKYVVVMHEIKTNTSSVILLSTILVEEQEEWKIRGFYYQLIEINNRSADYFLNIANEQLAKGNNRNAVIFYSLGSQLLINNPYMVTEYANVINDKIKSIKFENIPQGEQENWTTESGETFIVYKVIPRLTQEDIGIQINYITSDVNNIEQVNKESKELAIYVKNKFPEYQEVFDGIIIQAVEKIPNEGEKVDAYNNVYNFEDLK